MGRSGETNLTSLTLERIFAVGTSSSSDPGTLGQVLLSGGPDGAFSWGSVGSASLPIASSIQSGIVSIGAQSFAGNKTFTGSITASNLSGTNTGNVTLGTANGLSLTSQVLSIGLASSSANGALSSANWATFNAKQPAGNYITALTSDVTASGPGSVAATIAANAVSDSKLRDSGACSLIGRSANSSGDPADISASTNNTVLKRSSDSLSFATILNADVDTSAAIAVTKIAKGTANQMLSTNTAGTANEFRTLAAGTSGTDFAVAFGSGTVTLNLPDASTSARGVVTTGAQTYTGLKSFKSGANILNQGELRLEDTTGGQYVGFRAAGTAANYTLTFPSSTLTTNQILRGGPSTATNLIWTTGLATDTLNGFVNYYQSTTVVLETGFSTGTIRVERIAGVVTLTCLTNPTHSSGSAISSGAIIPTWARPTTDVSTVYIATAAATVRNVNIASTGIVTTTYLDFAGAAANRTSSGTWCISYSVS